MKTRKVYFELTASERRKVLLKALLAKLFVWTGAERVVRMLSKPALTIIVYHRVLADNASGIQPYIGVPQSAFREQLRYYRCHYRVVSLAEGVERVRTGTVDQPMLAITFDDGYLDNLTLALPVLSELGLPATVFVTTDCIDTGEPLWPDQVRSAVYGAAAGEEIDMDGESMVVPADSASRITLLKSLLAFAKTLDEPRRAEFLGRLPPVAGPAGDAWRNLMLDWNQVRALAEGGVTIGSHTLSHPILTRLEPYQAAREISESRQIIERRLGRPCDLFAYPNGTTADFDDVHVGALARAGYLGAVTTVRGVNRAGTNPFRLQRTGIYGTDGLTVVRAKLAVEGLMSGIGA